MHEKTPIQTAITFWNERYNEAKEAGAEQSKHAADLFLNYLDAMLSAEKEFAGKVFDAGMNFGIEDEKSYEGHKYKNPDKQKFINQLYPEK